MASIPEGHAEANLDTLVSPRGRSIFRKWLRWKTNKGPTPPKAGRLSEMSREPADPRSPSRSPARVDATNQSSWMAAGRPTPVSAVP